MKKILAAIDFSNATEGVLAAAVEMAGALGAELHLLHVIEPEPTYTAYGFTPEEFPAINVFHKETRVRAQKSLEKAAEGLLRHGVRAEIHLSDGSPLHVLGDMVDEIGADLVVLGAHGHGFVASLLLGSVAEGMVRKAKVATLVIPAGKEKV